MGEPVLRLLSTRMSTDAMISTKPMTMGRVSGSPKRSMPTHMAVMGSNAPNTAAMVLLICLSEIMSVTLLMAVGTKPSKKRLIS